MRLRRLLLLSCIALASPAAPPPPDPMVATDSAVQLGALKLRAQARGRCIHDEKGGPYEWTVQLEAGEGAGHFTLLLYAARADKSFSLMIATGAATAMISTMKGAPMGKGSLSVARAGKRARFALGGSSQDGTRVEATVDCESTTAE